MFVGWLLTVKDNTSYVQAEVNTVLGFERVCVRQEREKRPTSIRPSHYNDTSLRHSAFIHRAWNVFAPDKLHEPVKQLPRLLTHKLLD